MTRLSDLQKTMIDAADRAGSASLAAAAPAWSTTWVAAVAEIAHRAGPDELEKIDAGIIRTRAIQHLVDMASQPA